jgi:hypothetical protein
MFRKKMLVESSQFLQEKSLALPQRALRGRRLSRTRAKVQEALLEVLRGVTGKRERKDISGQTCGGSTSSSRESGELIPKLKSC